MEESKKKIDDSDDIYFEDNIENFELYYSKIKTLSDLFDIRKYAAKYHSSFFFAAGCRGAAAMSLWLSSRR